MPPRPHPFRSDKLVAALVILMTLVISGLGVLYILERYVPESYGRYGPVGPFFDQAAQQIGFGMVILGLLPLCFFARTAKQAAWSAVLVLSAFAVNIFAGLLLWQ